MQDVPKFLFESIVQLQANPTALIAVIAISAFLLIGFALRVVLAAINRA
ncbi:hypothetical protein PIN31009_03941 [Pandoraea iniqua]|uniref:Uncharacterized protein n=1 Tax=Pandoraea iniqua TaxID=2508288 RepID=A0A5E4Y456_9BURK|nr:hypothetical protein PIN31009_03941 [Pandoraea iniqua]VVE43263.1 hypothetical protein PIN31115_04243 [Pandoraea iniqua]